MTAISNAEIAERVAGQTVPERFLATVKARPSSVALRWKDGEEFRTLTFSAYAERAACVAGALAELGVTRGTRVAMLVGNRPEFHIADMAVLLLGGTPISIYNSSSAEQIQYLVHHCRAEVFIVENAEYLERVEAARASLVDLAHVVIIDDPESVAPADVHRWEAMTNASAVDLEVAARTAEPRDLVTIIYTSGTTGEPKGVRLDHANICWTIESLRLAMGTSPEGFRLISYLPMAHIAERMTSHYGGVAHGYEVTTCPDIRYLGMYLGQTRPELFFGVPRTFEKLHAGVRAVLAGDPAKAAEFERALSVGMRVATAQARGEEVPADVAAQHKEAEAEMLLPVRQLLGLDAVKISVTAAAPIPVEILVFFRGLGVPLSEMYGLSETSGPMTWEPARVRPGTVGRPIPGLELRLATDGEVQCRGGNVFGGYLDDPVRTAEVLDAEGWLSTGDIGELDAEGFLRIVDRKKELIITAGGKNVSPANVEAALRAQTLIGQACVFGDGEPYIAGLLVLDPDVAPAWAAARGVKDTTLEQLAGDSTVLAEVAREVDDANGRFSHTEQVQKWKLLPSEWLPDSEELTPTMKIKRRGIAAKYAREIAELFR
ncbi:MAG: long-chain fatty acid--CoA ligase [Acidimicrobiia bacterium]